MMGQLPGVMWMFERSTVDSLNGTRKTSYQVRISLDDGTSLTGKLHVATTRGLDDEVNSSNAFFDFEPYQGQRAMIAKRCVRAIARCNLPSAKQLESRERRLETCDPYQILGVARGADEESIKLAYRSLAKVYHPDRVAGIDLPKEVTDYMSAVVRRVNAAYAMLQNGVSELSVEQGRREPVFSRSGRAD